MNFPELPTRLNPSSCDSMPAPAHQPFEQFRATLTTPEKTGSRGSSGWYSNWGGWLAIQPGDGEGRQGCHEAACERGTAGQGCHEAACERGTAGQ
eukprot:14509250-Alexandrium_andersonii.AAC.1